MNNTPSSSIGASHGTPSGNRENMTGPTEGRGPENSLHNVDLSDLGESLEDHQRDRDSKGVAEGYDDSLATRKGSDRDYFGVARGD